MATLADYEKAIAKYDAEAGNIQETTKKKIQEQFNYGKPWLENIATWERNILPAFYEQFANVGTGASDLSPAQQMALAAKAVSRSGANADVARGIYSQQQQRESDMLQSLLNAWQLSRQGAVDAYNRAFAKQQADRSYAASQSGNGFEPDYGSSNSTATTNNTYTGGVKSFEQVNAERKAKNLQPLTREYYDQNYAKKNIYTAPSGIQNVVMRAGSNPYVKAIGDAGRNMVSGIIKGILGR